MSSSLLKSNILILLFMFLFTGILTAKEGLVITTKPSGAGVFMDGKKIGLTPLELTNIESDIPIFINPKNNIDLIVAKEFYEVELLKVSYTPGQLKKINIDLTLLKRLPKYDGIFQNNFILNIYRIVFNTKDTLSFMRNEIYAKHGMKFKNQKYVDYFKSKSWYKENPYYSDLFLDAADLKNIKIIKELENPTSEDISIKNQILASIEYKNPNGKESIIFSDIDNAVFINNSSQEQEYGFYYFPQGSSEVKWKVFSGKIYVQQANDHVYGTSDDYINTDGRIYTFRLDHKSRRIIDSTLTHVRWFPRD